MTNETNAVSKGARWTGYIMSALPVLVLLASAVAKLAQPPSVVQGFQKFGIPTELIFKLGILEIACTAIYLIPRTAVLGAILLTGYLGGAVLTTVRVGDPSYFAPALLGVLLWGGLFMRDRRVRGLIPLRH
jgi:hypothetical protein